MISRRQQINRLKAKFFLMLRFVCLVRLGLGYDHVNGHGASLTASRIPQLDMNTLGLTGKANLWSSPNRATTLDLTGGVSKHFGGPFDGQTNKQIGLGLNSRF
uniref:Attacin C-terminal domain-containing protein n=1 Tax=Glossina pallidipes TaxID=7398 RepID=A0A1B0AC50_GLOPL